MRDTLRILIGIIVMIMIGSIAYQSGITGLIVYDETTTFEVQDLTLGGAYTTSTSCVCPNPTNGDCIRNEGHTGDNGYVAYDFDLTPGSYDILVKHCPEDDGDDTYKFYKNGDLIETFQETSDSAVWEDYVIEDVELTTNDQFKIKCPKSSDPTYCRIDQVTFKKQENLECPSDIVSYWTFDNTDNLGRDFAGSNDGVLHGPDSSTHARSGKSLYFNSANSDYIDIGNFNVGPNQITISAWFYGDSISGDARLVSKAYGSSVNSHYWLLGIENSNKLRFRLKTGNDRNSGTTSYSAGSISNGEWIHAVAVYDGSNMILYKNGIEVGRTSKSGSISTSTDSIYIGANPTDRYAPFDGKIDEVMIFDRALTSSEINAIYTKGINSKNVCLPSDSICGNSIVEDNEECDDGNDNNHDECDNNCEVPVCGNNDCEHEEECDDGDEDDHDECHNNCMNPVCGNGIREYSEECDDGNDDDNDGCHNDCSFPVCGNGIQEYNEDCDDGNDIDDDECSNDCILCEDCIESNCENIEQSPNAVRKNGGKVVNPYNVRYSDDVYAYQAISGTEYLYFDYEDIFIGEDRDITSAMIYFEHRESDIGSLTLEINDGAWNSICDVPVRNYDYLDSCNITDYINPLESNYNFRLKYVQSGSCWGKVDLIKLNITHCLDNTCGDGIVDPEEECDDANNVDYDECRNDCTFGLRKYNVNTCEGLGDIFLYHGDQLQDIDKSFLTNQNQLLIFTRADYLQTLDVKLNDNPVSKSLVFSQSSPFNVKVYSVNTNPGDIVSVSGHATYNARAIQGYLIQDSNYPAINPDNLNVIYDNEQINEVYLTPGNYSYILFDKYTNQNNGNLDNRMLTADISDVQSNTYTQPTPDQGVVLDYYLISSAGLYNISVDTDDSIYWPLLNCTAPCSDFDADGICDNSDNCMNISNPGQEDFDDDGVGNVCDNCIQVSNYNQTDTDFDGLGDLCDNCMNQFNPNQEDLDNDQVGDICDNCQNIFNTNQSDIDVDGLGDVCDNCIYLFNPTQSDYDNDTIGDSCDNCIYIFNPEQNDSDSNGVGDMCEKGYNSTICCCGLGVSVSPDIASQNDKVLIAADINNIFTGLAAKEFEIDDVNVTIYKIDDGSIIVDNNPMLFLRDGVWYYEFYTNENETGSYIASVSMLTSQNETFEKEASAVFTIGNQRYATLTGISPDLINLNQTVRLAAQINGVDTALVDTASLLVTLLNGSVQYYDFNSGLMMNNSVVYLDGVFDENGVYYLDWTVNYAGNKLTSAEISVVVDWQDLLVNISDTVNTELLQAIYDTKDSLLDVLTNLELMQEFSQEEIFLITDSVNSMSKIADHLDSGEINEAQAKEQYEKIVSRIDKEIGNKISGLAITETKYAILDWRTIMFFLLLSIFATMLYTLIVILKNQKLKNKKGDTMKVIKLKKDNPKQKRRIEVIVDKISMFFQKDRRSDLRYELNDSKSRNKKSKKMNKKTKKSSTLDKKVKHTLKKTKQIMSKNTVKKTKPKKAKKIVKKVVKKSSAVKKIAKAKIEKKSISPKGVVQNSTKTILKIYRCEKGKEFVLHNGKSIDSLNQLSKMLTGMDDELFLFHVNESKNDFYNWIKYVFNMNNLAEEIKNLKDKKEISKKIKKLFRY